MVKQDTNIPLALLATILLLSGCIGGQSGAGPTPPATTFVTSSTGNGTRDLSGWTEFHPNWRRDGSSLWKDLTYDANDSEEIATDGVTYMYGRIIGAGADHEICVKDSPPAPAAHAWVFLARTSDGCIWAEHPGYGCYRAEFCRDRTPPAGPPP